jgi:aryl carrier-like protein
VLNIEQVSVFANFFALGGHSLLATQLIARIIEATHSNVTLRMLFEAPTIATFAQVIEQAETRAQRPSLVPLARTTQTPSAVHHDTPQQ